MAPPVKPSLADLGQTGRHVWHGATSNVGAQARRAAGYAAGYATTDIARSRRDRAALGALARRLQLGLQAGRVVGIGAGRGPGQSVQPRPHSEARHVGAGRQEVTGPLVEPRWPTHLRLLGNQLPGSVAGPRRLARVVVEGDRSRRPWRDRDARHARRRRDRRRWSGTPWIVVEGNVCH